MKVVLPKWLVKSARAGTLLDWKDYIFQPGERVEQPQGRQVAQPSLQGFVKHPTRKAEATSGGITATTNSPSTSSIYHGADRSTHESDISIAPDLPASPHTPSKQKLKPSHASYTTDPVSPTHASHMPRYAAHKSNESAARAMADPAWRAAHTSAAPDFIEGYYKNSRLHHLSTWKTELKTLVIEAQERAERGAIPGSDSHVHSRTDEVSMRGAELVLRNPLKGKGKEKAGDVERVIMHCDFDAFFVSAGLIDRPHLRGKPTVVCHSQGAQGGASSTSEIASASYEARKFGIKNGTRYAC